MQVPCKDLLPGADLFKTSAGFKFFQQAFQLGDLQLNIPQ